jgi:hypothetical protein
MVFSIQVWRLVHFAPKSGLGQGFQKLAIGVRVNILQHDLLLKERCGRYKKRAYCKYGTELDFRNAMLIIALERECQTVTISLIGSHGLL